eukprot:CAMPEP_0172178280 /NCGR_PEP_ID=MMETSP1050-20130122/15935_1 /TAXON_ID=233186 /ORGANISM="Cryptomonas curvata, Strain CCAP979/52" /LENGTH=342 /DNA_ID=CAMNT_0012850955 /DNA_START=138 /DNA_END=1163 /DNA_ORIENTATION=+
MIDGMAARTTACKRDSRLGFAFAFTLASCILIMVLCTVKTESSLLEETSGRLLHVTGIDIHPAATPSDLPKTILGTMNKLEVKLTAVHGPAAASPGAAGTAELERRGGNVASGQALDLFPISGTGAYHVNPINGRCLFGKLKDGTCRMHPRPKFKTSAYLNLPPERGPPDANGFRSEPPVKFPKALISVAGERQRVKGDPAFRAMVKEKMRGTAKLMERLQKVLDANELRNERQRMELKALTALVKTSKEKVAGAVARVKADLQAKVEAMVKEKMRGTAKLMERLQKVLDANELRNERQRMELKALTALVKTSKEKVAGAVARVKADLQAKVEAMVKEKMRG